MEDNATLNSTPARRPPVTAAVGLGLLLLAVDFTTKAIASAQLPLERMVSTVLPFLSWRLTYNTGSHYLFGSVGDLIPYRLIMGVAAAAVVVLVTFFGRDLRELESSPMRTVQWLMIATLIGSLGNALEVVVSGRATDFFMIHPFPWPANLCDQFVNVTVFVLLPLSLILSWRRGDREITSEDLSSPTES